MRPAIQSFPLYRPMPGHRISPSRQLPRRAPRPAKRLQPTTSGSARPREPSATARSLPRRSLQPAHRRQAHPQHHHEQLQAQSTSDRPELQAACAQAHAQQVCKPDCLVGQDMQHDATSTKQILMPVRPALILSQPRHILKRHLTQNKHAWNCPELVCPAKVLFGIVASHVRDSFAWCMCRRPGRLWEAAVCACPGRAPAPGSCCPPKLPCGG